MHIAWPLAASHGIMLHANIRMNTNQVYTLDIAAPVCTISADSYAGALVDMSGNLLQSMRM